MSVESLKRVMLRIRAMTNAAKIKRPILQKAIMIECGTSPATYSNNRKALIKLGWLRSESGNSWRITGKDLTEDF